MHTLALHLNASSDLFSALYNAGPFGTTLIFAVPTTIVAMLVARLYRRHKERALAQDIIESICLAAILGTIGTVGWAIFDAFGSLFAIAMAGPYVDYVQFNGTPVSFFIGLGVVAGIAAAVIVRVVDPEGGTKPPKE